MPLTLNEADGLLKEWYVDTPNGPVEQLNNASPFLAQLERSARHIDAQSDEAVWPLHIRRNWGVGSVADDGTLATAGNQKDIKARQGIKTHYIRIALTRQTMQAALSTRGAFQKATTREMKLGVNDLRRQIARQVQGTADGVIATCGTTSASTTVTLASTTTAVQMRQFEVDMPIDIGTLAAPTTVAGNRLITAIDATNKTLTISGAAVTTSSSHFVFLRGSGGGPGTGQVEMTGLQHAVSDTTTAYGLAPGTYPIHKATVDTNGGTSRPSTIQAVQKGLNDVYVTSGFEGERMGLTTPGVFTAIGAQMESQKRYPGEIVQLKGGYSGVKVGNNHGSVILTDDKDVPTGNIYLLAMDTWLINEWKEAGWEDLDGSVLHLVSGTINYEAVYDWMVDIATTQRNANWRGTNFIEA